MLPDDEVRVHIMRHLWSVLVILAVMVSACRGESQPPRPDGESERIKGDLAADVWTRVERLRVFFGHQSVGDNILRGIGELEADRSDHPVRVHDIGTGPAPDGAVLLHRHIGTNGEPLSKVRDFAAAIDSDAGARVDVAALKFCFWDIRQETNVREVFAEYERTIESLRQRHPTIRFLHITVPLFARDDDWRAGVRRLIGRSVPRTLDNAKRQELSELMRGRYSGREPVFDLARLEAAPETEGGVPSLRLDLTTDGGHLNAVGRRLAAEGFLRALADAGNRGDSAVTATAAR
jgi:hypothetical protein